MRTLTAALLCGVALSLVPALPTQAQEPERPQDGREVTVVARDVDTGTFQRPGDGTNETIQSWSWSNSTVIQRVSNWFTGFEGFNTKSQTNITSGPVFFVTVSSTATWNGGGAGVCSQGVPAPAWACTTPDFRIEASGNAKGKGTHGASTPETLVMPDTDTGDVPLSP